MTARSDPRDIRVEFPTEADAALHRAVHRVLTAVVELGGAVGWLHVPTEEETAGWLEAELALAASGRGGFAAAHLDGRLEAMGVWGRFSPPVIAQNAEVRKVMTHPDVGRRGLARLVMTSLADHARAAGIETLLLDCRGNNHGAQALYESLGWVEYGRIPEFIAVHGHRWDRVCYYLRLQTPAGVELHGSAPVGLGASRRG